MQHAAVTTIEKCCSMLFLESTSFGGDGSGACQVRRGIPPSRVFLVGYSQGEDRDSSGRNC